MILLPLKMREKATTDDVTPAFEYDKITTADDGTSAMF